MRSSDRYAVALTEAFDNGVQDVCYNPRVGRAACMDDAARHSVKVMDRPWNKAGVDARKIQLVTTGEKLMEACTGIVENV